MPNPVVGYCISRGELREQLVRGGAGMSLRWGRRSLR